MSCNAEVHSGFPLQLHIIVSSTSIVVKTYFHLDMGYPWEGSDLADICFMVCEMSCPASHNTELLHLPLKV